MDKTIKVMLGIVISILIALSVFGGVNFSEIKEKVTSVENRVTNAQSGIKESIKNIDSVKNAIVEAKAIIDQTNLDLDEMGKKLRWEFNQIKSTVKDLEEKRKTLDEEIAKIKEKIPGDQKELPEIIYTETRDIQ